MGASVGGVKAGGVNNTCELVSGAVGTDWPLTKSAVTLETCIDSMPGSWPGAVVKLIWSTVCCPCNTWPFVVSTVTVEWAAPGGVWLTTATPGSNDCTVKPFTQPAGASKVKLKFVTAPLEVKVSGMLPLCPTMTDVSVRLICAKSPTTTVKDWAAACGGTR